MAYMNTETTKKKLAPEAYSIQFPKNTMLKLRCREAKNQKSKSNQSPQHYLILEVIEQAPFDVEGQPVDINGLEFHSFSTLTEKALVFANRVRAAFGLSDLKVDDIPSADANEFVGLTCWAIVESEEQDRINELTKEPLRHPYTNEVMKTYNRKITEWIAQTKSEE